MPVAPGRWCPRCRATHDVSCPLVKREGWQDCDAKRPSSVARGYDAAWVCCRAAYLSTHPLCNDCYAIGRVRVAGEVHHTVKVRDDPSRRLDWEVLIGLCKSCHSRRTGRGE